MYMCRFVNEYDSELTVKTYCFAVTLMAFWSGAMDLALSAVQMKQYVETFFINLMTLYQSFAQ